MVSEEENHGFSAPYSTSTYTSTEELRKKWSRENKLKERVEVFVAETEGRIVGVIVFKMERYYGCIDNLVVAKEEQAKDIERALVA